jgi:plastocyanin
MHRLAVVFTLTALALPLVACGNDDAEVAPSRGQASPAGSATKAPSRATPGPRAQTGGAEGGVTTIAMKDIAFAPAAVTVKVGDTVKWVNRDTVEHNVVATKGATFKSGLFGQGGSFEFKPTKSGSVTYVCTVHPGMNGTLKVEK